MALSQEEVIEVIDEFIMEGGLWEKFIAYLEKKGYKPTELGFPADE